MHSNQILSKFLKEVCPFMHSKRRESLESVVSSCLRQERLRVTSLGRGIEGEALEKHKIKRADRLLSNPHLHKELDGIYSRIAQLVLKGLERAVILVDWSNLDQNQRHFLLRASVAVKGRSITIYEEVHTVATVEKLETHKKFLRNLKRILPQDISPILVTDAGFRITWFKAVEKLGWDWVGRIRGRMNVKLAPDSKWLNGRLLHPEASSEAVDFKDAQIGKQNNLDCRLVLYKANPKGRVMRDKFGKRRTWIRAIRCEKANREPLLLASSLNDCYYTSKKIVDIYSSRMQIEESFRDMKSSQYGIGLKEARTYKTKRMKVLVAIATLVNTFAWILGKATKIQKLHRHFQANSIKTENVLSCVFIGFKVFKQERIKIEYENIKNAWRELIFSVRKLCST